MPVKKPSAKATKAKKTVSAKAPSKPVAKAASKAPAKVKATAKPAAPKAVRKTAPARPQQAAVAKRPAPRVKEVKQSDERQQAGGSLLSGPRNVQPYVSRKGEEYMSKEQLDHFRQILSLWKQDLMQEVDRTMLHMKDEAANFPDPNDRASQDSDIALELRNRDRERARREARPRITRARGGGGGTLRPRAGGRVPGHQRAAGGDPAAHEA
jgi:DnaK suppressor protein